MQRWGKNMEARGRLSLVVGSFVLLSLAVLAVAVLTLTAERGVWRAHYRLVGYFDDVQGLVPGAPVHLSGKNVGAVESVTFGSLDAETPSVRVVLQVDENVQERIRSDSVAGIGTLGLLGDRYVTISMGTRVGRMLLDGAQIDTLSPLDFGAVASRGAEALDAVAKLALNTNRIVEEFQASMGTANIGGMLEGLTELVEEVRGGEGVLHSLIYEPFEGSQLQSVEDSLGILEQMLLEIRDGQGVLHTLIYEPPTEQDVVLQFLQAGARLNSILAKIDAGEGTAGLLLNDPGLYEDLELLVGGARRSRIVRSLIRLATDEDGP